MTSEVSQTLDDQGNLVGVTETVDFESREATTEEETQKYDKELAQKAQTQTEETP